MRQYAELVELASKAKTGEDKDDDNNPLSNKTVFRIINNLQVCLCKD